MAELLAACTPGGRDCPKFQAVCDAFVAHYDKHSNDHTAPYPGVMDLLLQCQAAGITMGIVSNKLDWAVKQLGDLHFPGMMAVCVGERPGIRRKPAPDVILAALEELRCRPGPQRLYRRLGSRRCHGEKHRHCRDRRDLGLSHKRSAPPCGRYNPG